MPALLVIPSKFTNLQDDDHLHTKFELAEVVREILKKAEIGQWKES